MKQNIRKMDNAIKAVRREILSAAERATNKVLAIYPQAESDPETAQLVFNIVGSQTHEAIDLFLRQFAQLLNSSLGEAWESRAKNEIDAVVAELEAGA